MCIGMRMPVAERRARGRKMIVNTRRSNTGGAVCFLAGGSHAALPVTYEFYVGPPPCSPQEIGASEEARMRVHVADGIHMTGSKVVIGLPSGRLLVGTPTEGAAFMDRIPDDDMWPYSWLLKVDPPPMTLAPQWKVGDNQVSAVFWGLVLDYTLPTPCLAGVYFRRYPAAPEDPAVNYYVGDAMQIGVEELSNAASTADFLVTNSDHSLKFQILRGECERLKITLEEHRFGRALHTSLMELCAAEREGLNWKYPRAVAQQLGRSIKNPAMSSLIAAAKASRPWETYFASRDGSWGAPEHWETDYTDLSPIRTRAVVQATVNWLTLEAYHAWKCAAVEDMAIPLMQARSQLALSLRVDVRATLNHAELGRAHAYIRGAALERAPWFWVSRNLHHKVFSNINYCNPVDVDMSADYTWCLYEYKDYTEHMSQRTDIVGKELLESDNRVWGVIGGCLILAGTIEGRRPIAVPRRIIMSYRGFVCDGLDGGIYGVGYIGDESSRGPAMTVLLNSTGNAKFSSPGDLSYRYLADPRHPAGLEHLCDRDLRCGVVDRNIPAFLQLWKDARHAYTNAPPGHNELKYLGSALPM